MRILFFFGADFSEFSVTLLNKKTRHCSSGKGLCFRDTVYWFTVQLLSSSRLTLPSDITGLADTRLKEGCVCFALFSWLQSWGLRDITEWNVLHYLWESGWCCISLTGSHDKWVFPGMKTMTVIKRGFTPFLPSLCISILIHCKLGTIAFASLLHLPLT